FFINGPYGWDLIKDDYIDNVINFNFIAYNETEHKKLDVMNWYAEYKDPYPGLTDDKIEKLFATN
ncbi:MAG: hypothetical protein Q8K60_00600, partial [Parachlamydiaceae bacterium]|nr:hypothetical protein [Parachlamydiaceae bacterium]